ncbi:MAG: biotin/lipoyl-binding protein, partial [Acidobacteria bacterium]|nr:biotin/lipoyl-binding protein [Acidobacteriota bacterium]
MDVKRDPAILKAKRRRQAILAGIGVVILIGISAWVMTLEPAAPTVDHNQAWTGKVTRGSMVREVRGSGTLVPEDIRWITATTSGRVERLVLRPGAQVKPDTVILELSNPDLQNRVRAAELSLRSAEAQLQTTRSNLATSRLQMEADVANAKSDFDQQNLQYEADLQLAKQELVSALALKQSQARVERLKTALGLAEKRLQSAKEGEASQLAPQEAQVAQLRATWELEQRNVADLKVKAGMTGQLQVLPVEVGQQVGAGTQVARVANPAL